jgi:uncharacterized protein YkwD
MHDSRGAPLKVGDRVLLEGELTQVCTDDNGYCNCNVKIVTPEQREKPPMEPPSLSAINTRMLTKIGAAAVGLLLAMLLLALPAIVSAESLNPMLGQHNAIRAGYGLEPCQHSPELTSAAQSYANYLAATGIQDHFADGRPWDRAARAGFTGTMLFNERLGNWYYTGLEWKRVVHHDGGEVLSFGGHNMGDAFAGWLKSDRHRAALLEPSFDSAGFGQSGTVHVGMFGNSRVAACAGGACGPQAATQPAGQAAGRIITAPIRAVSHVASHATHNRSGARRAILPRNRR